MWQRRRGAISMAVLACGLFTLVAGACSHDPRRPAANWAAYDSRNVRLYSSTLVEHQYAQEWLERAFHAYRSSFFKDLRLRPLEAMFLQVEPGSLTRVYLPNDDPPHSWALEGMPGGGRIGKDGLIVLTERRDVRGASKQVAYQLIGQAIPHAPLWLRVGFGQYLSEFRVFYKGTQWSVCYGTDKGFLSPSHFVEGAALGARPVTRRNVAGRDVLIPVDEMLSADWYQYAEDRQYWYSFTAYAFVSFLIHGRDSWHASRFPVLLATLAQGKSSAEALAFAYPHLLPDELDDEVAAYVRSPRRGVFWEERPDGLCFAIPSALHAEKRTARSPVAESDVQAALDDLKRMPLWREHGSWYPSDVLMSKSGILKKTPLPSAPPESPGAQPIPERRDPAQR